MIITPLTKLEAVNEILGAMGEAPLDTLSEVYNVDGQNALRMLEAVTRQVQMLGWTFNTLEDYTLTVDRYRKVIPWDNIILRTISTDKSYIRQRNGLVFDVTNNTSTFDNNLTVTAVILTPFEEMPDVFRHYVTTKTAQLFVSRYLGDPAIMQELQVETQEAYRYVMEYEMDLEDDSLANNRSVRSLMQRG